MTLQPRPGVSPASDRQFCESCGTRISSRAAVCPECGVGRETPVSEDPREVCRCRSCDTPLPVEARRCPDCGIPRRPRRSADETKTDSTDLLALVAGGTLLWFGLPLLVAGSPAYLPFGLSAVLSVVCLVAGLALLPPVRDLARRGGSDASFGTVHSVERSPVVDSEETCTVCRGPVRNGVERTYRKERVVFGITLSTVERGENVYCRGCARDTDSDTHDSERSHSVTAET